MSSYSKKCALTIQATIEMNAAFHPLPKPNSNVDKPLMIVLFLHTLVLLSINCTKIVRLITEL